MREYFTANQIALEMLALKIAVGSQKAAAEKMGISPQFFSDIMNGKREVSATVAWYFGYQRLCLFEKVSEGNNEQNSEKRYLRIGLTEMQKAVNERRLDAFWAEKRKEYPDPKAFGEFRDSVSTHYLNPRNVSEEDALNEEAPKGYRMIARDVSEFMGMQFVSYLFEQDSVAEVLRRG